MLNPQLVLAMAEYLNASEALADATDDLINATEMRREPGYIAFREDYRWRWNEPDAEPLHGWAAYFDKARWARIENASKAALEAENAALKADAERWRWP